MARELPEGREAENAEHLSETLFSGVIKAKCPLPTGAFLLSGATRTTSFLDFRDILNILFRRRRVDLPGLLLSIAVDIVLMIESASASAYRMATSGIIAANSRRMASQAMVVQSRTLT
jgi:hypothetical protein